jgi:hypothetical protein
MQRGIASRQEGAVQALDILPGIRQESERVPPQGTWQMETQYRPLTETIRVSGCGSGRDRASGATTTLAAYLLAVRTCNRRPCSRGEPRQHMPAGLAGSGSAVLLWKAPPGCQSYWARHLGSCSPFSQIHPSIQPNRSAGCRRMDLLMVRSHRGPGQSSRARLQPVNSLPSSRSAVHGPMSGLGAFPFSSILVTAHDAQGRSPQRDGPHPRLAALPYSPGSFPADPRSFTISSSKPSPRASEVAT